MTVRILDHKLVSTITRPINVPRPRGHRTYLDIKPRPAALVVNAPDDGTHAGTVEAGSSISSERSR